MNTDIILSVCYSEQDGCKSQTKAWRQAIQTLFLPYMGHELTPYVSPYSLLF